MQIQKFLSEAGVSYDPSVILLSEDAQLKVEDELLSKMFKFITDKYNSIDFSEIEKSAGDIAKFKYESVIRENANILKNVYQGANDTGAAKYVDVANAVINVLDYLRDNRAAFSTLYKSGNGVVQLLYTSMVASTMYATSALVSNTIRFVTTEQDTDCQVLYDEIPGSIKHIYIRNVLSVKNNIKDIDRLLNEYLNGASRKAELMHESVSAIITVGAITTGVIYLIPKIVTMIREIIYSVYFTRVRFHDMLDMQVKLIRTNIESLETSKRGTKKIIARQKKIADDLERWKDRVAVRIDSVDSAVQKQKNTENRTLDIDKKTAEAFRDDTITATGVLI